jgi:hypothetical protein
MVAAPIHWADAEIGDFVFTNQIFACFTGSAYLLTFGLAHGPYEVEADVDRLQREGGTVQPIAKIAVTPEDLHGFLQHLNGLYNRMSKSEKLREQGQE